MVVFSLSLGKTSALHDSAVLVDRWTTAASSSVCRVDHLYTFFVQWSPEIYGKDAKEQGFIVVEKEELDMIDNFFSEPTTKSWEVSASCLEMKHPHVKCASSVTNLSNCSSDDLLWCFFITFGASFSSLLKACTCLTNVLIPFSPPSFSPQKAQENNWEPSGE